MSAIDMFLRDLCAKNPEGAQVIIVFKSAAATGGPAAGALRKATGSYADDSGSLYELLAPGQVTDAATKRVKPVVFSNFFTSEAVERVMLAKEIEQPSIVTPRGNTPGGLVIPGA